MNISNRPSPGTGAEGPSAPHGRRNRGRSFWFGPALLLGSFIFIFATLLWLIQEENHKIKLNTLIDTAESECESVRLRLKGNQDYLLMLAKERGEGAMDARSFQERASQYVADHPEMICINWVDAAYLITDVAPLAANKQIVGLRLNLPEPERASRLARERRQPVYTHPFEVIQGQLAFELWVPVFHGDVFLGLFGGIYSVDKMLHSLISPQALRTNQVSMVETSGKVLFALPPAGTVDEKLAHQVTLVPQANGVSLRFNGYGPGALERHLLLLELLCLGLVLAMAYAMWRLKRTADGRRKSEAALRAKTEEANHYFTDALDLMCIADTDGYFRRVNKEWEKVLGLPSSELEGRRFLDFVHPDDLEATEQALSQLAEQKEVLNFVNRYRKSDAEYRWIEWRAFPSGTRVYAVARDITERRLAEQHLALMTLALDTVHEAAFLIDASGRFHYVNEEACRVLGYPAEELLTLGVADVDPDFPAARWPDHWRELKTRKSLLFDGHHRTKDGRIFPVEISANYLEYGGQEYNLALVRDRSEHKTAEETIRRLNAGLAATLRAIPDLLFELDKNGTYRNIWAKNPALLARQAEILLDHTVTEMLAPEAAATVMASISEADEMGSSFGKVIHLELAEGARWFELSVSKKSVPGEPEPLFIVLSRDITDRKMAEQDRLANLQFFECMDQVSRTMQGTDDLERMANDLLDLVLTLFVCDRAFLLYPCDPEASSWRVSLERTRADYPGAGALDEAIPLGPDVADTFRVLLSANGPVQFGPGGDHPLPAEAAQRFGFQSLMAMTIYPLGGAAWLFGLHQCSHARVWTANEERLFAEIGRRLTDALATLLTLRDLRQSESKLAEAQRIGHFGSWDRDFTAGRITLSDEACRIFGLPPQGHSFDLAAWHEQWLALIHPADKSRITQALEDTLRGEARYNVEYRIVRPNGEERIIHSTAEVERDESGRPRRMAGTMQDVTERKRAEEALQQSEARYRLIVDTAREGIWMLGPDALTTFVNARMATMLGFRPEEMIGKPLTEFLVEEERPTHVKRMEDRMRGLAESYECRFCHRDGSTVWVLASAVPSFDERHAFQGFFAMFTDISDRKKAEEALTISEAALKEAQRIAHIGHWEWNAATDTVLWSEELFRLFSLEPAPLAPNYQKQLELYTPESAKRLDEVVQRALATGEPYELDLELARPGASQWVVARGEARRDASGRILVLHGTAQDISERKKTEETIRKLNDELEQRVTGRTAELRNKSLQLLSSRQALMNLVEDLHDKTEELEEAKGAAETANRAKSTFLANMSHELRTPLNAILGFAQLLERSPDLDGEPRENLAIIVRSGEHLLGLINDVLEIAKIEAGHTTLNAAPFDLHHLLRGIGEMFGARAQAGGLTFRSELDPRLPRYVAADSGKIRQVLINLLGNAIKFTREGGVCLKATVLTPADGATTLSLHFEVQDSGIGIEAEKLGIIFDPFIQAGTSKDQNAGTGLGLTISRNFVGLMGGKLTARSTVGEGSVFSFDIPVTVADHALGEERPVPRVKGLAPGQREYRILIVEDRLENRLLLRRLLENAGFTVMEAVDGSKGVELFNTWQPDLIWMDIRMPVMDGLEATRLIKATERGAKTPVVALTASAFEEQRTNILAAGCDGFVRKPFRDAEIWEVMEKHLGVRFLYEEEEAPPQPTSVSTVLPAKTLALLDRNLLLDLARATLACEREACLALIESIPPEQDPAAQTMRHYVMQHKFDKLYGMLEDYLSTSGDFTGG